MAESEQPEAELSEPEMPKAEEKDTGGESDE